MLPSEPQTLPKAAWPAAQFPPGGRSQESATLRSSRGGRLTDHLATVLAARYAAPLAGWNGEVTEEFGGKLRTLRSLCQDTVELRRGDHSGWRRCLAWRRKRRMKPPLALLRQTRSNQIKLNQTKSN